MRVLVVIPARYASTRYPGKPLVSLTGSGGQSKTLIERSWLAANSAKGVDKVVVATDDDRIRDTSLAFGAEVVMTPETCVNGTERVAAAIDAMGIAPEIVINLQGDAPLTPAWFVEALVEAMAADPDIAVATPVLRTDASALNGFLEDRKAGRVGGTTAVFDHAGRALYFSKEVIPYTGKTYADDETTPVFHHVGVYGYRVDALKSYLGWTQGPLETLEGLEQLRFMENGMPVQCVEVDARGRVFWELNNPVDVERIEAILRDQGLE